MNTYVAALKLFVDFPKSDTVTHGSWELLGNLTYISSSENVAGEGF